MRYSLIGLSLIGGSLITLAAAGCTKSGTGYALGGLLLPEQRRACWSAMAAISPAARIASGKGDPFHPGVEVLVRALPPGAVGHQHEGAARRATS